MATVTIRLPDVGEGVAEAELVEWSVSIGDVVREDEVLAAVMTDKATVEIPSPASGKVVWLGAELGQTVAVGSDLVRIEADAGTGDSADETTEAPPCGEPTSPPVQEAAEPSVEKGKRDTVATAPSKASTVHRRQRPVRTLSVPAGPPRPEGEKPLATPAVRLRAREAGVDLRQVPGTGPAGNAAVRLSETNPFLKAAARGLEAEWQAPTVLKGTGGAIPLVGELSDGLGVDCVVIGFILESDAIHAPDEHYDVERFHRGTRSWIRILSEVIKEIGVAKKR